jgi:hypothetical protein
MMSIKDISASTELDRKAMTEVRGGDATIISTNAQSSWQHGAGGLVNVNDSSQSLLSFNKAADNDVVLKKIEEVAVGFGNTVI